MPMPQPHIEMQDPRVVTLARWRQQISHEGVYNPTWEELTDEEREGSLPDARNYLKAAIRAGLVPNAVERKSKWPTAEELQKAADIKRATGDADDAMLADWLEATANALAWLAPFRDHEPGNQMWESASAVARRIIENAMPPSVSADR